MRRPPAIPLLGFLIVTMAARLCGGFSDATFTGSSVTFGLADRDP